ncbi:MAG TPA: thioredoxin domain-containing protein [Polyangium sp.]|nr:thioredoxin domain-containing protein [Polyangium sp.]
MRSLTQLGRLVVAFSILITACGRGTGAVETQGDESEGKAVPNKVEAKALAAPGFVKAERVSLVGAKIKGNEKALVTIVEFSDYACPYCNRAHATVEALLEEYRGRVRLAAFENPLPFHTTAVPAAKWAFAAGEQGKYWEARDLLFGNQKKLDDAGLAALAGTLGLDLERLEKDRTGQSATDYVETGLKLGKTLGVQGTPTFFVNGVRMTGAQPAESFRKTIEEELRRAEALVATGVRPENVYAQIMEKASAAVPAEHGSGSCESGDCDCAEGERKDAPDNEVVTIEAGQSPTRGHANAEVTLVAFTDTECPFCAQGEERIRTLEKEYGSKIRVVYKNMPMPFHKNALPAAKAMMAAHKQGKFFEYKDVLFAHQDAQERADLLTYAQEMKLDMNRFSRDLDDPALEAAIQADLAEARRVSAVGTPTFFINGRKLIGAQPIGAFRKLVDAALAH